MKNFMEYKGYTGSVEYSEEDDCLFGKVLGIRSLISYEGDSVASLREDFQSGVDDYLETCSAKGVAPEKPYKGTFNVRVSPEVHREVAMRAAEMGMSLNSFVANILQQAVQASQTNLN
ncbi:DNA repair protein HhH-GPD [Oscillospiraceae bacterium]|nr:DNA repair protein HhH-GPD [Oscillospiraceae bacterium]BDF75791.1 DNA repair protein HhH-GPD [Oscillospiraceae bacterium]